MYKTGPFDAANLSNDGKIFIKRPHCIIKKK